MSHQDESVMRALATETNTDSGTSCATCREMRREKQDERSHEDLLHRS